MKGIVLRDFEVLRLASAGSVLIWRRVNPQPDGRLYRDEYGFIAPKSKPGVYLGCTYGSTGETRFVKETWRSWDEEQRIIYKADYQPIEMKMRWKSAVSMPSEASRFRVTLSVSCRQIQCVTEEEAEMCYHDKHPSPSRIPGSLKHRAALSYLLEQVYPGCTSREDWFWAIEAKEVK